jgi:hypothetical protein
MTSQPIEKKPADDKQVTEHVTAAHSLLQDLRAEVTQHPKLEDAILRLEMALSLLTTKSGGML